jgi:hypothetical protein
MCELSELRELSLLRLSSQRRYRLASGGLGAVSGPTASRGRWCDVPKLSKLLNQEDALSAPCYTQVIAPASADEFPDGWRQLHGQSAPVQGQAGPSWQDGPEMWILTSTVVRFLGDVESELRFLW